MLIEVLIIILCYLLGSLPAGYFLVKYFSHEDIRETGSQSVGATNVGRLLGTKGFLITFCIDCFKSFLVVFLIIYVFDKNGLTYFSALGLVLGHIYPIFLNLKGGKGIAVTLGVLLAYNYILLFVLLVALGLTYLFLRKFTSSGLLALMVLPLYNITFKEDYFELAFLIILNIIILIAHKKHIQSFLKQDL